MLPLIPILCLAAMAGGGIGLWWYDQLSEEEKENANFLASEYAYQLYGKTVAELTNAEAQVVHRTIRAHFE